MSLFKHKPFYKCMLRALFSRFSDRRANLSQGSYFSIIGRYHLFNIGNASDFEQIKEILVMSSSKLHTGDLRMLTPSGTNYCRKLERKN